MKKKRTQESGGERPCVFFTGYGNTPVRVGVLVIANVGKRPFMKGLVLAFLLGSIVLLLLRIKRENREKTLMGWLIQNSQTCDTWCCLSVHGVSSEVVKVRTENGSYTVTPMNGVLHRVEAIPVKQTGIVALRLKQHGKRDVHIRGQVPFKQTVFGGVVVTATKVTPQRKWFVPHDLERTHLPHGGVMMSDLHSSGVDLVLVPGKSAHMRSLRMLETFRAANIRLHIVYYEDHSYARRDGRIDCGFHSGSIDNSVNDVGYAIEVTRAKFLIGYSLGGLIATMLLVRSVGTSLLGAVLITPFLSYDRTSRTLDPTTKLGGIAIGAMRRLAPVHHGNPYLIENLKVKLGYQDYNRYAFPLVSEDPDDACPPINVSFNFVQATTGAMAELKRAMASAKTSSTPVLLIGCTQDSLVSHTTNMRVCQRLFEEVSVRTLPFTHHIFPSVDEIENDAVQKNMMSFLSSKSRDVMIPGTEF